MPEIPDGFMGKLGHYSRDINSVLVLLFALGAFGWILTGNTYFQRKLAVTAGVDALKESLTAKLDAANDELTAKLDVSNANFSTSVAKLVTSFDELSTQMDAIVARSYVGQTERKALIDRMEALEKQMAKDMDPSPAIRFASTGNHISDGCIGCLVTITWRYVKLRDCGKSEPDDLLMDVKGVVVRFDRVSVLDDEGRGIGAKAEPDAMTDITYTAMIPNDAGLEPGLATGWVNIGYDHGTCPAVAPTSSPHIPFNILPPPRSRQ